MKDDPDIIALQNATVEAVKICTDPSLLDLICILLKHDKSEEAE